MTLRPNTRTVRVNQRADGALDVALSSGETLAADDVILATGYKVGVARVPLLNGERGPRIAQRDGSPMLDDHFQTSLPGLFVTSMAATGEFGPFFGFTVAACVSVRHIGRAILRP